MVTSGGIGPITTTPITSVGRNDAPGSVCEGWPDPGELVLGNKRGVCKFVKPVLSRWRRSSGLP